MAVEPEDDDLELELEDEVAEPDGQEGSEEQDPEEGENVDIEIEPDPLYGKPNWKEDPANKLKSEGDDDYGRRAKKRIDELVATGSELKRQLDQARAEQQETIRAFKAMQKKNAELEKKLRTGSVATLEKSAEAEERALTVAQRDWKEALSVGDVDKAAEAQRKIAEAAANVGRLRDRIAERKEEAERPEEEQKAEPQIPQPKQIQQAPQQAPQVSPLTVDWFNRNPWFNPRGGDKMSDFAIACHWAIKAKGVPEGSEQYFRMLDKSLQTKFPDKFGISKSDATPPPARRVSERADGTKRVGGKIKLTKSQLMTAAALGLYDPEKGENDPKNKAQLARYYREILALEKGKE